MSLFRHHSRAARSRAILAVCLATLLCLLLLPTLAQVRLHAGPHLRNESPASVPAPGVSASHEEWEGVYFGGKKVGYSSTRSLPTTYQSRPARKEIGREVTRLQMLGATVEEDENTETILDLQNRPLKQTFDVRSNGSVMHIEAAFDYTRHKVNCTIGTGPNASQKTLDIPKGANLTADTSSLAEGQELVIGKQFTFYYLEPINVQLQPLKAVVVGKETVQDDNNRTILAFRIQADVFGRKLTLWTDPAGSVVKGEINMGIASLILVRENKGHALDSRYLSPARRTAQQGPAPPADFADATAIVPDRPIANPGRLRFLKAVISDIPAQNLLPSDTRQQVERLSGGGEENGVTAEITVQVRPFAPERAATLPVQDPHLAPYLEKAAYLETTDSQIRATAERLRGQETNLYRIASSIRNWVHAQMTPDASIGVPRSATDVFARRRGVCRDYATLYTALARAAGVPTRLCGGIVYSEGKFFYHAWAESYVGQWVAFDPTLYEPGQPDFVDATHIKFAQGDVIQMFDVVSIVGRLKIRLQAPGSRHSE